MLATAEELATQLGRTFDTEETARAEQLLTLASGVVEAYVGRTFTQSDSATYDVHVVRRTLVLNDPPVDVTSITYDDVPIEGYTVYPDAGVVHLPYGTGSPVQVTYVHGMSSVPDAVKSVVLTVASRLLLNSDGVTQKSIGDVSVSYGEATTGPGLSPLERQVLDSYRIVGVA